jgi:hypothetical protein
MATLDPRTAPKMAIHRATLLNPEDPRFDVEGAALGVAELGSADAVSGGTAPADAVGPGVAATEDDGDVFAGASATYARVPSTGCPSPATTRHARVRFPADMEGSTTCADVAVGNVTSSFVTTPDASVTDASAPIVSRASEKLRVMAPPAATVDPSTGSMPTSDVCALAGTARPIVKSRPDNSTRVSAKRRLTAPLSPVRHATFTESFDSSPPDREVRGSQ